MKEDMISWLLANHVESAKLLDNVVGPVIYLVKSNDYIRIERANTAFEELLDWQGYNWQQGMYMEHLVPVRERMRFFRGLEQAAEELWQGIRVPVELQKRTGRVLNCTAHIFCIEDNIQEGKYLIRLDYDREANIKDALFMEALYQSKINCWYWDMSQGDVSFFNTDIPANVYEKADFMNDSYVYMENFPYGFVESLDFVGEFQKGFMDFIRKLLSPKTKGDVHMEFAFQADADQVVWVSMTAQVVRNDNGMPEYAMGTWKNITQEKIAQQQQQHNSYLMGSLIRDSIYDLTVNLNKNFFVADESLEKWMGDTRVISGYYDLAVRELALDRVAKEDRQKFLDFFDVEHLRSLPEDENFSIEYRRRFHGKENWFRTTINIFSLDEYTDKWMYVLIYDIDTVKRRELMLEQMAATDALTGLYNRAHSLELMGQHIEANPHRPGAIVYMDLDNFKSVNDTLGHAAGDSLLICVAEAMRHYFGKDAVLGRIGGDEFILMCYDADKNCAAQMMESFVDYVGSKCQEECSSVDVTVSLGYVLYPDYGSDVATLANLADKALYLAKRHGKNMAVEYQS